MVLELLGTRIVAPYIGSSLYVWTSLIGVILTFLSLGYYWGGALSQQKANIAKLSDLVLMAAVWVFIVAIVKDMFMLWIVEALASRYLQSIVSSVVLFGVPSFLLGAVSPYAARLAILHVNNSGASVGKLYAISTAGSIVGTFLTGFIFVPVFGHVKTMYMIVASLILVSMLFSKNMLWIKALLFGVTIWALVYGWTLPNKRTHMFVVDTDTAYTRTQVAETQIGSQRIRSMYTDGAHSSAIAMNDPTTLMFDNYYYYDLMFWNSYAQNVLMIGGAGMGYPRYALRRYPDMHMTVVEIDPELYSIAKNAMGFEPTPNLTMVYEDGRVFLNKDTQKYDAILFDVFSAFTMPWHLATKETTERANALLADNGVVIINTISALDGKNSNIIRSLAATYKSIFEHVEVFATKGDGDRLLIQNLMLVASKKPLDMQKNGLSQYGKELLAHRSHVAYDHRVLTDDWSPVDVYTSNLLVKQLFR